MIPKTKTTKLYFFTKFFLIAFIFNFVWENLHSPLYLANTIGINNHLILMLYASFMDAVIISIIFIFISLINKDIYWKLNLKNSLLFLFPLFFISFIIEKQALLNNRWIYNNLMPTIFGIGLSPLIQLATTGILSVVITKINFINN